jgi:hypothetical protein
MAFLVNFDIIQKIMLSLNKAYVILKREIDSEDIILHNSFRLLNEKTSMSDKIKTVWLESILTYTGILTKSLVYSSAIVLISIWIKQRFPDKTSFVRTIEIFRERIVNIKLSCEEINQRSLHIYKMLFHTDTTSEITNTINNNIRNNVFEAVVDVKTIIYDILDIKIGKHKFDKHLLETILLLSEEIAITWFAMDIPNLIPEKLCTEPYEKIKNNIDNHIKKVVDIEEYEAFCQSKVIVVIDIIISIYNNNWNYQFDTILEYGLIVTNYLRECNNEIKNDVYNICRAVSNCTRAYILMDLIKLIADNTIRYGEEYIPENKLGILRQIDDKYNYVKSKLQNLKFCLENTIADALVDEENGFNSAK